MGLLLDTQTLVWAGSGDRRLSAAARTAIIEPTQQLFISSVTAYEFEDLRVRDRLGTTDAIGHIMGCLAASILDYPADAYRLVGLLPKLHRDPVDRMLIAHALHADMVIVTADATIREYPVRTLW